MENGPGETESQNHRIAFAKGESSRGAAPTLRSGPIRDNESARGKR